MGLSLLLVQAQVVKKHKTMCILACLTHLLYASSSHYVSRGYLIKYAQNQGITFEKARRATNRC